MLLLAGERLPQRCREFIEHGGLVDPGEAAIPEERLARYQDGVDRRGPGPVYHGVENRRVRLEVRVRDLPPG
jgi:hypothetical protein